jgi:hypothetical protein
MRKKRKSKMINILIIIFISSIGVITFTTIYHQIYITNIVKKYPAPGKFVSINGRNMHILSEGKSDKKIILLSGWGTAVPSINFKPLINKLKKEYNTVVIENFGYGWSDRRHGESGI